MSYGKAARSFVISLAALGLSGAAAAPALADPIVAFELDGGAAAGSRGIPARLAATADARGSAANALWFAANPEAAKRTAGFFSFPGTEAYSALRNHFFHQPLIPAAAADQAFANSPAGNGPDPVNTAVPEVGSILMLGTSLLITAFLVRRRSKHPR